MLRLTAYDVFRRLPRDLTHGTTHGGVLSVLAVLLIALVFFFELWTYLTGEVETAVMLDTNREQLLQINFRILVPQLPCEFASIDVWDYLGNNKLDIGENIHKTMVAGPEGDRIIGVWEDGMARSSGYSADEVKAKIGIEESTKLSQADFKTSLAANQWSFVDYYAPWCIHWYV
jgi:Endoplasmic Reticulum-Golgi Intermediate Compartment (ERGIC)